MIKSAIFESNPRYEKIPGADLINDSMDAFWSVHRHAQFKPPRRIPSAFAVGTGVLQIESGMTFGSEAHSLRYTETGIFNWDYTLRYGFWKESLEFSLTGDFQRNAISYTQGALPSETRANFKNNVIGAKYLVYDPTSSKRLMVLISTAGDRTIDFNGAISSRRRHLCRCKF